MLRTIDRVLFLLICLLLQTACGYQEYTSNVTAYQDMPSNPDSLPDSVEETSLDYFRDCQTFDAVCNNICYAEVPWADTRSFCEQEDRLQELNAIPLATRYDQFDASAFYDETGGIFFLSCSWLTQRVGEHESLQLDIYPQRPESPEKVDGFYYDLGESVTVTEADDMTIYGVYQEKQEGNPLYDHCLLEAALPDGAVWQITAVGEYCREDAALVLDFLRKYGVNYDAFAMEYGDEYTWATLDQYPTLFSGCVLDISGLPFADYREQKPIKLKNGKPVADAMDLTLQYTENGALLYWSVSCDLCEDWLDCYAGKLDMLTHSKLVEWLQQEKEICIHSGAYYIMIHYPEEIPSDAVAALMERLPNFPKDTDVGEIKDVFASENE